MSRHIGADQKESAVCSCQANASAMQRGMVQACVQCVVPVRKPHSRHAHTCINAGDDDTSLPFVFMRTALGRGPVSLGVSQSIQQGQGNIVLRKPGNGCIASFAVTSANFWPSAYTQKNSEGVLHSHLRSDLDQGRLSYTQSDPAQQPGTSHIRTECGSDSCRKSKHANTQTCRTYCVVASVCDEWV